MRLTNLKKLVLTAMFLALGFLLPFLTGQIEQFGKMLLPMHLPVFLCALICGWQFAVPMALILPILRSAIFIMPPMYPNAIGMSIELGAYALTAGLLYFGARKQTLLVLYRSLLISMLVGRVAWGLAQVLLLGLADKTFTFGAFLAGAFLEAIPGMILQLILIPCVMLTLDRAGLVPFRGKQAQEARV